MNNRNKLGFSAFEILVVLVLYASIFAFVSFMVFKSTKKMKFKSMKYDAIAFSYNVETYLIENNISSDNGNKIYLKDLIVFDDSYSITSPFDAKNACSIYNSYVEKKNSNTYVTLECDHYIIYEYDVKNNANPDIYWISSPMKYEIKTKKGTFIDEVMVYNYKKNGSYVFTSFLTEEQFIKKYNEKENQKVTSIKEITSYEFRKEYRIRKAVKMD